MKLYFVTVNEYKSAEVQEYFRGSNIELQVVNYRIQEILHINLDVIVEDKILKAYQYMGHPCVVEHGGLYIHALNGLPGGLSKVVWDTVGDRLCKFLQSGDDRSATAKTVIGYCDGHRVQLYRGETKGVVAPEGIGSYQFQWDPIFIPDGCTQTYAEMGFPAKKDHSQAAKAWAELIKMLTG